MRLFIAEKPSLGRAIADALGNTARQDKLSITLSNGDIVCWAAGHILELPTPEELDPKYRSWAVAHLPIIPSEWQPHPMKDKKDLYGNITRLLKEADIVVNAGDADREGQLLIDEILTRAKYKGKLLRILVNDLNRPAVERALQEMRPNSEFKNLSLSAEARQRADWLLGLNMTRLFTATTARRAGEPVVSVGRVQTPTLALVVTRDRQIEDFVPKPFFMIKARSIISNGEFIATWKPSNSDDAPGFDEDGRITDKTMIDTLKRQLSGKLGHVTKFEKKTVKTHQPMAYKLPTLQIDASKLFDMSPAETLQTAQSLYEKKLTTYPRSQCDYLPETIYSDRKKIMECAVAFAPEYSQLPFDLTLKTACWNSKEVTEHHAIVPTGKKPDTLTEKEKNIYALIIRRFAALFLPPQEHAAVALEYKIDGEIFTASAKQCTKEGWHILYSKIDEKTSEDPDKSKDQEEKIPDAVVGEQAGIRELYHEEKKTTPPKRFTEATLLEAMNNIHRYVDDPEKKKILKETQGIGTPATQAKIISNLLDRDFIVKDKKVLISTPKGRKLIDSIDDRLSKPDTTAMWEQQLNEIKDGRLTIDVFLDGIIKTIREIIADRINKEPEKQTAPPRGLHDDNQVPCPACGDGRMRQLTGKFGKFWVCGKCGISLQDDRGKPQKTAKCPACGGTAVRINGKNGFFWGCRNLSCKKTFTDDKGKPVPKR